jgi:cation diffusion facilitator CzcD-associated flavoprotein CzcO
MAVTNGNTDVTNVEALVIGAGFSGIAMLYRLRKLGIPARVLESGADFGGVWYWNRYPGARVDSEWPYYQLDIPEVYNKWTFRERFPGHAEIREYFGHLDSVLNLRKDVSFNSHVYSCTWDDQEGKWEVRAKKQKGDWQGQTEATNEPEIVIKCRYLIMCTGLLHRRHYPDFPGLKNYKGELYHTGFYPENHSMKGKKVGIVGAGATAVQVVQEVSKEADHLTCFFRRPSYCLPMCQRNLTKREQEEWKGYFPMLFSQGRNSLAGFPTTKTTKKLKEDDAAARRERWDSGWARGGFQWSLGNYADVVLDKDTNREVYAYWAEQVRKRMKNEAKKDLLAPLGDKQPYFINTKRMPLEQDYYECMDQDNVDIVDLTKQQFKMFNEKGVELSDGTQLDFDTIILATGFDSFTGS